MRRAYLIVLLAGVTALAVLVAPAAAAAGTYTWSMPGDFTATGSGANPDHDQYGGTPWAYLDSGSLMGSFSSSTHGGLAGWSTSSDTSALVGVNDTASPITFNGDTYPAGQAVLAPGANPVSIRWTAPTSGTFSVTGAVQADDANPLCVGGTSWSLDVNGVSKQTSGAISRSLTLNAGDTVSLVASKPLLGSQPCDVVSATLRIQLPSSSPTVTLNNPGAVNNAQPTFTGTASNRFGDSGTVTVNVYSGSSASGTPVQTLHATRTGTTYSVSPNSPLPNGTFTARASQTDLAGDPPGLSSPETFTVSNTPPTVTLNSPGSSPLATSTPTLTGTASTGAGYPATVAVFVYPGPDTSQAPVARALGTRDPTSGRFSIQLPSLGDGQYTAVAVQNGPGGSVGQSSPQTFRIKAHPPALTLTTPAKGANVNAQALVFSGAAGDELGDSNQITLTLYAGSSASGSPVGTIHTNRSGATWSAQWPSTLKLGLYTVTASQSDDAGHTTVTPPRSFLVVQGPTAVGKSVSVSRSGRAVARISITCVAPAGQTCTGNVLILTASKYRTVRGGPSGRLRVLFAYVSIQGGKSVTVSRKVSPEVAHLLRRTAPVKVDVSAALNVGAMGSIKYSAVRTLRLGS